uniref:Solute carrier family 17 member 9b n=1 Tax=Astyanax mexicanus TaxID=7994 RepID=A0A3B1K056_ASTMX
SLNAPYNAMRPMYGKIAENRPVARVWTVVLLLGTCLLYCARVAMPICAVSMAERFSWSKRESGMVLGSFFWGYCFTQVLGGYVSDRVGGEKVMLLSAAAWGAMTAFTPILAHFCSQPIVSMTISRFLMGLLQGVHYPSLASLCSQKVVESERGFLMSTVGSGSYLGTLVIGGVGSLMLDMYGWESVFYISGLLSVLWAYCMWKYLLKGEGELIAGTQSKLSRRNWLRLFRQPAVCAVIVTHLCTASTFFTLLSWLPTFFKDTFPDSKGWVFNVIPWFVAIPSSLFSGCLSDHLISQGMNTHTVNVQDLAPSCAGALFGMWSFLRVIMVYLSGYLIEATNSWASVFALISVVNLLGLGTFLAFAEARRVDIDATKGRYHNIHI